MVGAHDLAVADGFDRLNDRRRHRLEDVLRARSARGDVREWNRDANATCSIGEPEVATTVRAVLTGVDCGADFAGGWSARRATWRTADMLCRVGNPTPSR